MFIFSKLRSKIFFYKLRTRLWLVMPNYVRCSYANLPLRMLMFDKLSGFITRLFVAHSKLLF